MLIAHITDFHIVPAPSLCYGFSDTRTALQNAVAAINAMRPCPDIVIASGDLVDEPSIEAYTTVRDILSRLDLPLVILPGNHDDRRMLSAAFPDHGYLPTDGALANFVLDFDAVRIIGFDAVVPGKEFAVPTDAAMDWLEITLLQEAQRPTLIAMHHPPMRTGLAFMDAIQPPLSSRLTTIIQSNSQVKLIVCGHVHRTIEGMFAGTRVSSGGSTGHQFAFAVDLDQAPELSAEPSTIRLHLFREGEVTSFMTPVRRDFTVRPFAGLDAAEWGRVSTMLRHGAARPVGATVSEDAP